MEKPGMLERLEEKIVFRISRFFFLSLAIISMLVLLVGVAYFGWSLTPSTRAQDPKPVLLTASDIKQHIGTKQSTPNASAGTLADTSAAYEESRFNGYVDTLKELLPSTTYSWDPKGDFSGGQYVTTDAGIGQKLSDFTKNFGDYRETNAALSQLCSVLREFPQDARLAPLDAFIEMYTEKATAHKELLDKVEAEFQQDQMSKANGKYEGLIVIATAISTMAFLAIFLVLLSVQRNIKMLASR